MRKLIFASALALCVAAPGGAFAAPVSEAERAALHAAMLQHIDRQAVDGVYLHMDLKGGVVETYSPAKAHPMMFSMGDHFVLCTDFKDKNGKATNVDFYLAKRGKSYAVFQTEIANREPLMQLMKAGKVKSIE